MAGVAQQRGNSGGVAPQWLAAACIFGGVAAAAMAMA